MLYNIFEKLYATIPLDAIRINVFHSSFMGLALGLLIYFELIFTYSVSLMYF